MFTFVASLPQKMALQLGELHFCALARAAGGSPYIARGTRRLSTLNITVGPKSAAGSAKVDQSGDSTVVTDTYDADKITVLEGLEPVRKRPGMYIGSTGTKGYHHLVFEVVDNSIDEALAGHCSKVEVRIGADGFVEVSDDGRGIPVASVAKTGKSALETVLTVLHAGGKFGDGGYKVSGGLHGVGLSVVNALSDVLEVHVWRDSKKYSMRFARGIPQTGLLEAKDSGRGNGTTVRFHPDPQIFERGLLFQRDVLANRLRELSFLNAGLRIVLKDDRILEAEDHDQKRSVEYKHDGGIKEYIALMCKDKTNLHTKPIFFSATRDGMTAEVVLQWCSDSYSESIFGFVNNIKTIDGGTHIDGFKFALSKAINNLGKSTGKLKSSIGNLSGEFIREGLTAILSVKVPNPEFEGQTKTKLGNPEVRDFMRKIVEEELSEYFDLNVKIFTDILEKATQAHNAANAARSARELVRRKNFLETSTLPGKLADCSSRDPYNSEIFIVEGESAGGSAKQARNRENQAILPLRGKILNVERTDDSRLYANSEVQALIQALGLGFRGEVLEIPKLRYHRIIIMTDADVDGAHIRTLLLTLFFRYQRELITEGLVYIACPPLYKLEVGLKTYFAFTPEQLEKEIAKHASGRNHRTMRFKGLGEMMATELWDTTMNPQKRVLRQVTVEDAMEAETMFSLLMGDNVLHRREYIQSRADEIELEELDI